MYDSYFKRISRVISIAITVLSFSLHAAQPAPAAGAGELGGLGRLGAASILNSLAAQNANYSLPQLSIANLRTVLADLRVLLAAREERTVELNNRLRKATKETWNADKKAIQDAVENDAVHPDDIQFATYFDTKSPLRVACERFDPAEVSFIQFLVKKGARADHANFFGRETSSIRLACTVDIARLLLQHGSVLCYNELSFNSIANPMSSPEVTEFYLNQGAVAQEAVKPHSKGYDFLMFDLLANYINTGSLRCSHCTVQERELFCRNVEIVLQAGAPLSTSSSDLTIPFQMKLKIDDVQSGSGEWHKQYFAILSTLEQILKKHSDYRHDGIKKDLKVCKGTNDTIVPPELHAVVISYFVKLEPLYEQLIKSAAPQPKG